jgi:uncharacterized membrane protein YebE (DUF533 family)
MADDKALADCATGTVTSVPLTADEQAQAEQDAAAGAGAQWAVLRAERDTRLAACDWTQLGDTELSADQVTAWGAYRQALRDLPEHTADPANPDWPEPPPTPTEEAAG